jgi:C1A family cysteine protease
MPDIDNGENMGEHCVVMVGFDDMTKYFLVRNSWGTEWGCGADGKPYDAHSSTPKRLFSDAL